MARIRAQLDRIDAKLLQEDDPQEIERLSRAACALSRELAKLLGIPEPGSLKPSQRPERRRQAALPEPVVPATPQPEPKP